MATRTEAPGELSALEHGAWKGLLRVHAAMVKALDAELEQRHGMPLTSYEVLLVLHRAPGSRLRMSDLADHVLLSRSGVTRLVDRLEREGLLERISCSSDGRGCFAALTPKGGETVERIRPDHLRAVREQFLRHFSDDELETMATWWTRLLKT